MADWEVELEDVEGEPDREPLEPGSPDLENVVFLVLGVLTALAVIVVLAL